MIRDRKTDEKKYILTPMIITLFLSFFTFIIFVDGGVIIKANKESGFYKDEFYLTLSSSNNSQIFYTTDGSKPDKNSAKYDKPILIKDRTNELNVLSSIEDATVIRVMYHIPEIDEYVPKGTIIRAVAYDSSGKKSDELALTFFVGLDKPYQPDNMMTINITADPDDLFGKKNGIYVAGDIWEQEKETFDNQLIFAPANFTQKGELWERDAIVSTILPDGESYVENIVLSIHGGSTTRFNQKSFNLKKLRQDGYLYNVFNSKSLILRTGGHDLYSSQMKDVLCQKLIEGRDIRIQRAVPVQVFLNGEYWGFYWLQERIDNHFISTEYGVKEDHVTVVKNKKVVEGNDKKYGAYADILEWVQEHDLADEDNYLAVCEWIDIDSYIDYICFEVYVQNLDCISNNVSMWKTDYKDSSNKYADGKWRWIIYDIDRSCFDPTMDSFIENEAEKAPLDDLMFTKLLENMQFRRRFKERFQDIAINNFEYGRVEEIINDMVAEIEDVVIASHVRFIGPDYDMEKYYQDVDDIKVFFRERNSYILKFLDDHIED